MPLPWLAFSIGLSVGARRRARARLRGVGAARAAVRARANESAARVEEIAAVREAENLLLGHPGGPPPPADPGDGNGRPT